MSFIGKAKKIFEAILKPSSSNTIVIDGKTFKGNSVSIDSNGKVVIDGKEQEGSVVDNVSVTLNGDAERISTGGGDVTCGKANKIDTMGGDVTVDGHVSGNITTMGGDVDCYDVIGDIKTMGGDVTRR